jgi:hypothetical protein
MMNAQGRKQVEAILANVNSIGEELQSIIDDEQAKFDNMPEGLQNSERGESAQAIIDALESARNAIDEASGHLEEIGQ